MKTVKAKILAACSIMMLAIMLPVTSHAITYYGDRASWDTAVPSSALVDITGTPEGSTLSAGAPVALPAGADAASISFSIDLVRDQVPTSWATWSGGESPAVFFTGVGIGVVDATFSSAVAAFGLEMEPNQFATYRMALEFADGTQVTQLVAGLAGAKFFGFAGGVGITGLEMSCASGCVDQGFAFGRMVTQTASVPEPSTLLLLGSALAGLGIWRKSKTRS